MATRATKSGFAAEAQAKVSTDFISTYKFVYINLTTMFDTVYVIVILGSK